MRFFQAEGILLSVTELAEQDRIVTFLTREHGKRRGVARGAKRRYSRFAGELQPLAKARLGWFEKEGRELGRVSAVEMIRPAKSLGGDLEGILAGACLAEQVGEFAPEDEPNDALFRLLDSTLAALESGVDRGLALAYVEVWVLRLAGIFPPVGACPRCGKPLVAALLAASGESLLCESCAAETPGARRVSGAALEALRRIGRERLPELARQAPGPPVLAEISAIAGRIRRHFLQHELRSYEVRERTLDGLSRDASRRGDGADLG
ncbi:MAG: DNA repair protein RecO [Thermoanaerobaculia bacterium]